MSDIIDTYKARIDAAESVERELTGKKRDGLSLQEIGDYTIVDDGQDRWIVETDKYNDGVEEVLTDILEGRFEPCDDEGHIAESYYNRLCSITSCIYSRIGINSDVEALCESLDCGASEFKQIMDSLGLLEETLPAIMIILNDAGDRYSGDDAYNIANEWIEAGFSEDECPEWVSAGFWSPAAASQISDAGMTPDEAVAAANYLIDVAGDNNTYTDGCPIYSLCNCDTSASEFIEAHRLISEST